MTKVEFVASGPLLKAIFLRLLVQRYLDLDDMKMVRALNKLADEAYSELSPAEACAYIEFFRPEFDKILKRKPERRA